MTHLPKINRRGFILGLSAIAASANARLATANTPSGVLATDNRLVVVILRGAMDGMAALAPYGDVNYSLLRGSLALSEPGQEGGLLDCGGFFGLNRNLTTLHSMYREGQLLPIHAVAGPYRNRSHFEAQDMLESGAVERAGLNSGWLNRALVGLPTRRPSQADAGLAVGLSLPLLMRGPQHVGMWAPPRTVQPAPDLYARMADLLHLDLVLGPAVADGLRSRGYANSLLTDNQSPRSGGFVALAGVAGKLLGAIDGPRVAALELGGWDTHMAQTQRMDPVLTQLDAGMNALRAQMGVVWQRTAVLVMTEFGRTARVNGNNGTDHGTGGVAFLLGGAVLGGRVLSNWPGLKQDQLFEQRDLQPTRDLRSIAKALLKDHLHLPNNSIVAAFPGSEGAVPERGLLRA
jgi:uncharacterized protein (DUF1501 family)